MDNTTEERRSYTMSRIRSKDTKPELQLRKELFKLGFRYRLHVKGLPGKPDIVFKKYKTVVFVHGCFWHLHKKCRDGRPPKSKLEYWIPKLNRNVERDLLHKRELKKEGWSVITVWECQIKNDFDKTINRITNLLSFPDVSPHHASQD